MRMLSRLSYNGAYTHNNICVTVVSEKPSEHFTKVETNKYCRVTVALYKYCSNRKRITNTSSDAFSTT